MDMEADLGIDSIKRIEILGAMQERFPDLPQPHPEELGELRTLGQIIEQMRSHIPETPIQSQPSNGSKPVEEIQSTVAQPVVMEAVKLPDTIDFASLSQTLLAIVSEKTGYPPELLELDMDMEADLGIDSIKRIEILGAMQERFPDLPQPNPDELGELRTLGQIIEQMKQQVAEKKSLQMKLVVNHQV